MDDANSAEVVFRPPLARRMLILAVWLLFALAFALASPRMAETETGLGLLLAGIALLGPVFLPAVYHYVWTDCLTVSTQGIVWHIQGFSGFIPWANIGRVARWRAISGLQLNQPVTLDGSLYARLRPGMYFGDGSFIPISHIVPVPVRFPVIGQPDLYWRRFRSTDFGRLLEQHVPHIFEQPFPTVVTQSGADDHTGIN
jgi:hypothetical protein